MFYLSLLSEPGTRAKCGRALVRGRGTNVSVQVRASHPRVAPMQCEAAHSVPPAYGGTFCARAGHNFFCHNMHVQILHGLLRTNKRDGGMATMDGHASSASRVRARLLVHH
jgi:hypothetical protein